MQVFRKHFEYRLLGVAHLITIAKENNGNNAQNCTSGFLSVPKFLTVNTLFF